MTTPASIVHVVPRLSMTGPVRSIAAGAKYADRLGLHRTQRVVALERELSPAAVLLLRREGIELTVRPTPNELDDVVRSADLVLVHFWNCPSMFEFLLRPIPDARVIVWIRMQGLDAPQVVPPALVDYADARQHPGRSTTHSGRTSALALPRAGPNTEAHAGRSTSTTTAALAPAQSHDTSRASLLAAVRVGGGAGRRRHRHPGPAGRRRRARRRRPPTPPGPGRPARLRGGPRPSPARGRRRAPPASRC